MSILAALAEAEACYDGPIPEPLRRTILAGSPARRLLVEAEGQVDFFAALIRDQIEAIRRSRRQGRVSAPLLADLGLYRRQELWWRREAARRRAAVTPSATDAP